MIRPSAVERAEAGFARISIGVTGFIRAAMRALWQPVSCDLGCLFQLGRVRPAGRDAFPVPVAAMMRHRHPSHGDGHTPCCRTGLRMARSCQAITAAQRAPL